jgi:hypothetical protein
LRLRDVSYRALRKTIAIAVREGERTRFVSVAAANGCSASSSWRRPKSVPVPAAVLVR